MSPAKMNPNLIIVVLLLQFTVSIAKSVEQSISLYRYSRHTSCNGQNDVSTSRKCECDKSCHIYGDCCQDSPFLKSGKPTANDLSCVYLPDMSSEWKMVTTCPAESTAEERQLCQQPNEMDPILSMIPIRITAEDTTSVVYRNIYCARCNDVSPVNFKLWDAKFRCYNGGYNTGPLVEDKVEWNEKKKKWLYIERGTVSVCDMVFRKDLDEIREHHYRACNPIVDTCPPDFRTRQIADRCMSYTNLLNIGSVTYRNTACLLCNEHHDVTGWGEIDSDNPSTTRRPAASTRRPAAPTRRPTPRPPATINPHGSGIIPDIRTTPVDEDHGDSGGPIITVVSSTTEPAEPLAPAFAGKDSGIRYPVFFERGIDKLFRVDTQCLKSRVFDPVFNKCRQLLTRSQRQTQAAWIDTCNATTLEADVFFLSADNSTVTVPKYRRTYGEGMFRLTSEHKLLLCEEDIPQLQPHSTYALVTGVLTAVGLSVSIIFLVIHLFVVTLVPEIRNLSGMNLTSLCLALLGAYGSFIAGGLFLSLERFREDGCYIVAILTYYFFMTAFFWMFIIAVDVTRVLRASLIHFQVTHGLQSRRFIVYSIVGWGCPFVFATAATLFDNAAVGDERFRPHFGSQNCWFGSADSLLVFFVVPLAIVMTLNIGLFVYAAVATAENPSRQRKNVRIYFKLTVMLGLTWAVGLLASALNSDVLWVVFSILNTLQGLFIFISFTLTTKVSQSLAKKFPCYTRICSKWKIQPPTKHASNVTIDMVVTSSTPTQEKPL